MPKYIFLDAWLLSDYTKADKVNALTAFIARNQYTIIISEMLLVELYNKNWEGQGKNERGWRIVNFLTRQSCVVVDPHTIWQQEFQSYPNHVKRLPVKLDLAHNPAVPWADALLKLLRRDAVFLDMGIDIAVWANEHKNAQARWLTDTAAIIEDGIAKGELIRDNKGHISARDDSLQRQYLFRLDMRHIADDDAHISDEILQPYIEGVFRDNVLLRAVRMTSLTFWYQYVGLNPVARPKQTGSDFADITYTCFIPWCAAYTADKNMSTAIRKAAVEAKCTSCKILDRDDVDKELRRGVRNR